MTELRDERLDSTAAAGLRFGVVVCRVNGNVTERLLEGALEELWAHGAAEDDVRVVRVPGAYELPMGAQRLIDTMSPHAVICLGALVRGETPHFDVLAHSTAIAVHEVAMRARVPIAFGLLTCDTMSQALARAGVEIGDERPIASPSATTVVSGIAGATDRSSRALTTRSNKGAEATLAAIEMALLFVDVADDVEPAT